MIKQIHILLTYKCILECDHCFVFSSPNAEGVFTFENLKELLYQIKRIKSIDTVYFEGGEPFLYYPLMVKGIEIAKNMGLKVGIVTNAYWAITPEDAKIYLEPLKDKIDDLSISSDKLHWDEEDYAQNAIKAAKEFNIPYSVISLEVPTPQMIKKRWKEKKKTIGGEGVIFKGRAVYRLSQGLPKKAWHEFTECLYEDLENPERVHIDPYGNIHICQGIIIGNFLKNELKEIFESYNPKSHPIIKPIIKGGPAELVKEYNLDCKGEYIDCCHLCFTARKMLMSKFKQFLCPENMYFDPAFQGNKFFIGYIPTEMKQELKFDIKEISEKDEREFVINMLKDIFGEIEFFEFNKWYNAGELDGFIGVVEKEYVGFALYKIEDNFMTLLTINVKENYRRMGIGSALLDKVKEVAKKNGLRFIRVPVSNDDLISYVFYLKNGFKLYDVDIGLCERRHGKELKGFFGLPLRDEFYLKWEPRREIKK